MSTSPSHRNASSVSGSFVCSPGSTLELYNPLRSNEITRTVAPFALPSSCPIGTPVQVADALHPSTQAIGSSAVVCGIPFSSSRLNVRIPCGATISNRHPGSRAASVTPAAPAVRLTGNPCGPLSVRHDSGDT